MKSLVGWGVSWGLFWLGDAVSHPLEWWDGYAFILYPVYNALMCASVDVQNWGGAGPWEDAGK